MRWYLICAIYFLVTAPNAPALDKKTEFPDSPSTLMEIHPAIAVTLPTNIREPNSPQPAHLPVIDKRFFMVSAITTAAIFADSDTTTWIGDNYRAHGGGPCTVEGGEPALYGVHPTAARSYEVAALMSTGAVAVSYIAKRYLPAKLHWMWPSALIYETGVSIHGFTTNLSRC